MSRASKETALSVAKHFLAFVLVALTAFACGGGGGGDGTLGPEDIVGLRFVSQPNALGAGETFTVTVELVAKGDKRVTAATDMVTLAVGGGATLSGTTSVAAVAGVATFTGISIARAGTNLQLTATARGFSNTSGTLSVAAGAASAAQSTVVLNPVTLNLNVSSSATFTFKDAYGNPLGGLAVVLSSTLAGVTFTPSSGTTNADGTFATSIRATTSGSATLSASVGGVSINIGSAMNVFDGAVALRFVTQPVGVAAGQAISASVELINGAGARVATATNPITLSANGGLALTGTTTVSAVAGLATFTGVSVSLATAGVVLTASGAGLSVQSTAFTVAAGAPSLAQSTLTFPGTLTVGVAATGTFTIKDALGNPVGSAGFTLTSSLAGTTFNPATGTTSATGVFTSSVNTGTAGAGTITASVNGISLAFPVAPIVPLPCTIGTLTLDAPLNGSVALAGNGCVLNNHPAATVRVTIPASTTPVPVQITSVGQGTFLPELRITPDPAPTTGAFFIQAPTATPQTNSRRWWLPTGSFLVSTSSSNGNAGTFTLTAASVAIGGAGCVFQFLPNVNATYSMALSTSGPPAENDCVDSQTAGGPYTVDALVIFDSRPCTITMSAAFDTYFEVYELNTGNGITADHGTAGGNNSRVSLNACGTAQGPLELDVTSWQGSISGAYTIQIAFTGGSGAGTTGGGMSAIATRVNEAAIVKARPILRRQR